MDNNTAVYILLAIVGACIMLALGAFFGKKMTVPTLAKYMGIIALVVIVCCVIYIAWVTLSNQTSSSELTRTAIIILGVIIACCALLSLGGVLGRKVEVFRVVISCGIIVIIAFVVFLIYIAITTIFG
jgi:quinol-cytochrome oxidoreductase complex cytochrome b subunit